MMLQIRKHEVTGIIALEFGSEVDTHRTVIALTQEQAELIATELSAIAREKGDVAFEVEII